MRFSKDYAPKRLHYLSKTVYNLKRLINVEKKNHDTSVDVQLSTSSPDITLLSGVAIGDGPEERDGNQIRILTLQTQAKFTHVNSTTQVRAVWFIDKSPQGSNPNYNDIFENNNPRAFVNKDNGKRFWILKSQLFTLSPDYPGKTIKFYKRFNRGLVSEYNGSTAGNITNNHIYFACIVDIGTDSVEVSCNNRITYVDN